jgi:hypothetical protein
MMLALASQHQSIGYWDIIGQEKSAETQTHGAEADTPPEDHPRDATGRRFR